MAFVFAPDGTPGEIPDEQLQTAVQQGYVLRKPSDAEWRKADAEASPITTGAEGFMRGVTMGLSDKALVEGRSWLENRPEAEVGAELQARKEAHPFIAGASELGGAVGTAIATGGGASARVGGGVTGAAFESGLYGMGSVISEAALENTDLTAERLGAGFAGGALVNGAVAGTLKGVGKGASALMSKFGGKGLKTTLDELAYKVEERALAEAQTGAVRRLERSGGSLRDVVEYAKREGIPVKFNAETVQQVQGKLDDNWSKVSAAIAPLDGVAPLADDTRRVSLILDLKKNLRDRFKGDLAAQKLVNEFADAELNPLAENTDLKWGELFTLQRRLREKLPQGESSLKREVYDAGRKEIRNAVFAAAEANGVPQGVLMGLQKDYAKGAYLKSALETRIAKNEATGGVLGVGVMDVVRGGGFGGSVGAAVLGPVGAPLGAVAGAYGNRLVRERGAAITANALRALAESKVSSGISKGLSEHLQKALTIAPEVLGAYRFPLAQAAALGADALVAEHVRLASGPQGQDYLARTGLPVESPAEVEAAGRKLALLDSIQQSAEAQSAAEDAAIDGMFGAAPGRKGSISKPVTAREFGNIQAGLYADTANPDRVFEQVPAELRAVAPMTATQAAAVALKGKQFLLSKAPKDPNEGMPVSVRPPWQPSAADLDKFSQYKEAVESPYRVLKNMANGYVSPEQVEALKAVYPSIYSHLQQKIGERLATWQKPLTFQQKLAFSTLLGAQALGMSPQQAQMIQQSQALALGNESRQGGNTKPPDGRQDVDEAQMETESQKLEARRGR